jgi:photosystem II stability/assembly factor-like uncharacterized protein
MGEKEALGQKNRYPLIRSGLNLSGVMSPGSGAGSPPLDLSLSGTTVEKTRHGTTLSMAMGRIVFVSRHAGYVAGSGGALYVVGPRHE